MDIHEHYMARALELANSGWGKTNPNPLVGAVFTKKWPNCRRRVS